LVLATGQSLFNVQFNCVALYKTTGDDLFSVVFEVSSKSENFDRPISGYARSFKGPSSRKSKAFWDSPFFSQANERGHGYWRSPVGLHEKSLDSLAYFGSTTGYHQKGQRRQ